MKSKDGKNNMKGVLATALLLFLLICLANVNSQEQIPPAPTPSPEQYYYPSLNNPSNFMTWQQGFCNESAQMDFIVELTPDACQPNPVTSDLLEEQDVPVLCRLTGVKINPFIQVPYIKRIEAIVENQSKEISYINFYPARSALGYYQFEEFKETNTELSGVPTLNNLGYLAVYLKQQPVEKNMSKNVSAKIAVNITYDVAKTYGVNTHQFTLPLMSQQQWIENYKKYGFWNGKGYLRVIDIKDQKAKISVYTNPSGYPLTTKEISVGGDPIKVRLPGFYCQGEATITLDDVSIPKPKARIIVNGDELLVEKGSEIEGSGCRLDNLIQDPYSYGGEAVIKCENSFVGPTQEFRLSISNSLASLKITSGNSAVTEDKSLGDEIQIKNGENTEYYYVGYVGGTSGIGTLSENNEIKSIVILFAKTSKAQMKDNEKINFVRAFQDYLKNNRNQMGTNDEIKTEINKDPRIKGAIEDVIMIRGDGPGSKVKIRDTEVETVSTNGLKQLFYSRDIENKYSEAIKQYRQVAREFRNQKTPEGGWYGIQAYKKAAELASFMYKEQDEVLILQDLVEQYKDSPDSEILAEVEDARQMILALTYGAGDRSVAIQTDQGTFLMTLLFIERASFDAQEARLKVNDGEVESYFIGSQIGGWVIQDISDNGIVFSSGTTAKTMRKGNVDMLAITNQVSNKVEVVDIRIQKEASVSVLPFNKEQHTSTNFSVVIGIEKRAIQLTPEQTKNRIKALNKTIEAMNKYIRILNTTTQAWKTVCYAGGTALWAKNLITGLSGESLARKIVMKSWTIKCASEDFRKQDNRIIGISECYRKYEKEINQDIASVKDVVAQANDFIKDIKEKPGVVLRGGIFGLSKQIDDDAFIKAAEDAFETSASQLNTDTTVQVELGRISRQQREDLAEKIRHPAESGVQDRGVICGQKTWQLLNLMELTDAQIISNEDKNLKNCLIEFPITVKTVLGNLTKLSQEGIVYTDDVKEIYYMLALNQKASSGQISQVVKDYNNAQIFSKFTYYNSIIKNKVDEENLKDALGLDIQHYSTETIKALTVSSVPLLTPEIVSTKFSQKDRDDYKLNEYANKNKYLIIATDYEKFFAILEETTAGKFTYKKVFNVTIIKVGNEENIKIDREVSAAEKKLPPILEQDISKCKNEMKKEDQNIKFWESGPYAGFVAYMPISKADGWYFATKSYTGTEGNLVAWKENGQLNEYWICNVGDNGKPDFNFYKGPEGDDGCCYQISKTTGMEIAKEIQDLTNKVETDCIPKAVDSYQKKESPIKAGSCGSYSLGKPPVLIPSTQCEDFMSPTDCLLLFNLCDPVICPPSRCDFSGRFPVDNVIQSGIIGSLVLCSGNSKEVVMPICITGLYNGLDALNNMVFKQYAECLQKQLDTGQTTGICDYFHSVYLCQILWGNIDPFIKGGLPEITSAITQGGGEYANFAEAVKSSQESMNYFTNYYGANTFAAFKARSVNQTGTNICSRFVSIVTPTNAKFFEDLTKADSYYQVFASVDEIPMGGGSPESQYRVFYNIYAGQDTSLSYYVYLKKKPTQSYAYEMEQIPVRNAVGFLGVGQTAAEKRDFTAPSGYNEVCVNVNGKDHCGFGTVSTSFAVQELQNVYLQDQIKKNIKTEQECKAGSASIIPTASLNLQSQVQEHLQPEIYRRGIVRQCSSENPGASTDPSRYQRIGYCNDQKIACWLDMQSVNASISDLGIVKDITTYAEDQNLKQMIDQLGLDTIEQSQSNLDDAQSKTDKIEQDVNLFIEQAKARFDALKTTTAGTSGTGTGQAISPLTGEAISSVNDVTIEWPDANIPVESRAKVESDIKSAISRLLEGTLTQGSMQYFPNRIEVYVTTPHTGASGLAICAEGKISLSLDRKVIVNADGSETYSSTEFDVDPAVLLHEVLHCMGPSGSFRSNLKIFLESTSLNKYQSNTRDTLIKRLQDWGVNYVYTPGSDSNMENIAIESWTTIGEYLYTEFSGSGKYEFTDNILNEYTAFLKPDVIAQGKNNQGPETSPLASGTATGTAKNAGTDNCNGIWEAVTSQKMIDIKEWAVPIMDQLNRDITNQIVSLKKISDKCARPEEKARAELLIAKLLDLRTRTYSVVDIEREMKCIEDQTKLKTCGDVGGVWKTSCESGETDLTGLGFVTDLTDISNNPNKKCCSSAALAGTAAICWPINGYQNEITIPICSEWSDDYGQCIECNRPGRCFGDFRAGDREDSRDRYHAGVDLLTEGAELEGTKVVAIESGVVTGIIKMFYPFNGRRDWTSAVLVYNKDQKHTVNYGEVGVYHVSTGETEDLGEKIEIGAELVPGDTIGILHKMDEQAMVHLELYEGEVTRNTRWYAGQVKPDALINPQDFITGVKMNGKECYGPQVPGAAGTVPTNINRICIDPGHKDNENPGKVSGCTDSIEAVHVLAVAKKLETALESKGYDVYLTRDGEERNLNPEVNDGCDNGWRAWDVNKNECDITISLHSDGSDNSGGDSAGASTFICDASQPTRTDQTGCQGSDLETYLYGSKGGFPKTYTIWNPTSQSEELAEKVNAAIKPVYDSNSIGFDNTIKPDTQTGLVERGDASSIGILCRSKMPTVLLEIGGHNNKEECQTLEDASYQQSLADAIATGVYNYISSSGTTPPVNPPAAGITGEAMLVLNNGGSTFVEKLGENLFDPGENIRICAVIKDSGRLYSGSEVSSKNSNVIQWSGATPTFTWYNIVPLQHPDYSGAEKAYKLPAADGSKNDMLQYSQQSITGNDWCITANSGTGTYWYRAVITTNVKTYSSLGKPAQSSDKEAFKTKFSIVNFDKYSSKWSTLLEPASMENYGISPSVMRISRKSNYASSCGTNIRCKFISTLEAFKNLPFAYGCGYYNCGEIPASGTTYTSCPTLTHLSGDFVAINCINLMVAGLSKTTGSFYDYNDFDNFISKYTDIQSGINKQTLSEIFRLSLNFGQGQPVEVGDVLFMWKQDTGYTHTFVIYKDVGTTGKLDENDIVVYASGVCPGSNTGTDMNPSSTSDYNGQLCYAPIGRYKNDASLKFTLVKIKDLRNIA